MHLRRLLSALLLCLTAGVAVAQPAPGGGPGGGVPVTTEPVTVGAVPIEVLANGLVAAESVVTVRARVDGQITQLHVTEGQMVRRGQPLFTLDSRLNQALLAQQEATLARDRALAARTQSDQVRYQSLRGESFASAQRFEQAQADALAAAATARATEALIAQTKLGIEFATVTAEIDGRLGALPLRAGNFMRQAENTSMATITQIDPVLVQFAIPERWLPEVRASIARGSAPVRVRPEADAGPMVEGALVFVDSSVDAQTGTILLKARFSNTEGRLWPGQYVTVVLVPRIEPEAISVPVAALQTGQSGRFVYVVAEGVARRRPVELVRTLRERAVLRGELRAGDSVIVDGAQRVNEGTRVQVRNQPQRVSATQ